MRLILILTYSLLIIFGTIQRTTAVDCVCRCCSSVGCNPVYVGNHYLTFCTETVTCKSQNCVDWHSDKCPAGSPSQTVATCESSSERLLPTLFILIVACFYKVFLPTHPRRSIQKLDFSTRNTTKMIIPYRRTTTMPQIRLDWLEKFGLLKRTSPSSTTSHFFKQRF